jgi:hypothetical protein
MLLTLSIGLVSGILASAAPTASGHEPVTRREGNLALLEREFGPPVERATLITGIDADLLVRSSMPSYAPVDGTEVRSQGVRRTYRKGEALIDALLLNVGVHASAADARGALAKAVAMTSAPPRRSRADLGDAAVLWTGAGDQPSCRIDLAHGNVYMSVYWFETEEKTTELARRIVTALDHGAEYVSRGRSLGQPMIVDVQMPQAVALAEEVTVELRLQGIEPARALVGVDSDWLGAPHRLHSRARPGDPPSITICAPRSPEEAGEKSLLLVVASPANVIATKEITLLVEAGDAPEASGE